jgi:hypothetical protein
MIDTLGFDSLSETAKAVLSIRFDLSNAEKENLVRHGFWHVQFFAQQFAWADTDSDWIGVRIIPNVALQDSPVVSVNHFGAITVSPTFRDFIPNLILHSRIAVGDGEFVSSQWSNVSEELQNLHEKLGGSKIIFDKLTEYLLNQDNFNANQNSDSNLILQNFANQIKDSKTLIFRQNLESMIKNTQYLPQKIDNLGAWNDYLRSAVASRAWSLYVNEIKPLKEVVDNIWLGFDKSAPFDSDIKLGSPISQFTISRSPAEELRLLSLAVVQPFKLGQTTTYFNDPLFEAAKALASNDFFEGYKGVEHMEAAAKLDVDLNDGKRSYEALVSASFWSAMNLGFPYKESYQAALHLAAKYGWDEMLELLEMNEFELQG